MYEGPPAVRRFGTQLADCRRATQHRTSTTDYNIFLKGSMVLITPAEAYDPANAESQGKLQETVCHPGDVVVQRGTMHA